LRDGIHRRSFKRGATSTAKRDLRGPEQGGCTCRTNLAAFSIAAALHRPVPMAEEGRQIIYNMVKVGKTLPSGKKILNDIYLGFYYGAKIGILGLNGSGKSTLMRIIAGKDKDFHGDVHITPGIQRGPPGAGA
jgi:ABC-type transport system involved in cytochrome bd biosynthesis fused ATPase/permease subunit